MPLSVAVALVAFASEAGAQSSVCRAAASPAGGSLALNHHEVVAAAASSSSAVTTRTFALNPSENFVTVGGSVTVTGGEASLFLVDHAAGGVVEVGIQRVVRVGSTVLCTQRIRLAREEMYFTPGVWDESVPTGVTGFPPCSGSFPPGSTTLTVEINGWSQINIFGSVEGNASLRGSVGSVTTTICMPEVDADGDGVTNRTDCDDFNSVIFPGAPELCDTRDNDCDGAVDEIFFPDGDGDGFGGSGPLTSCVNATTTPGDCNDANASVNPAASEQCGDGIDNDCDGVTDDADGNANWFRDADTDGFGDVTMPSGACAQPAGFVANADDCDDTNSTIGNCNTRPGDTVYDDDDTPVDLEWNGGVSSPGDTDVSEVTCLFDDPTDVSLSLTPACYDVSTTAEVSPPVIICIDYTWAELMGLNPMSMCILHCDNLPGESCRPPADCLVTTTHDFATPTSDGRICAEADAIFTSSLVASTLASSSLDGVFLLARDESDPDFDGTPSTTDTCPNVFNPSQADADGDGFGDACDVCPNVADPAQTDSDGDGTGDACESSGGQCCSVQQGPNCGDTSIEACVCAQDAYCCNTAWDQICVNEVESFQCGMCGGGTPGGGDCCSVHGGSSCGDQNVAACVCAQDPYCCNTAWDQLCVNEVTSFQCGVCQ